MRFPWDEGSAKRRTSLVVLSRIGNESAGIDPICGIAVGGRLVRLAETQPEFLMPSPIRKLWDFVVGLGIPLDWLLSAAVVLVWVLAMALLTGDVASALTGGAFALLPLAFIWFKDPISEIVGTGMPLSIRLGPGILGKIFDGLLRPVCDAAVSGPYVKPGGDRQADGSGGRLAEPGR